MDTGKPLDRQERVRMGRAYGDYSSLIGTVAEAFEAGYRAALADREDAARALAGLVEATKRFRPVLRNDPCWSRSLREQAQKTYDEELKALRSALVAAHAVLAVRGTEQEPDPMAPCTNCGHPHRCHHTRTNCTHSYPPGTMGICGCGLFEQPVTKSDEMRCFFLRCPGCGLNRLFSPYEGRCDKCSWRYK